MDEKYQILFRKKDLFELSTRKKSVRMNEVTQTLIHPKRFYAELVEHFHRENGFVVSI